MFFLLRWFDPVVFILQGEFDTHDPSAKELKLSFLRKRSKIVEIVAAKDIVFALAGSGVCVAFERGMCVCVWGGEDVRSTISLADTHVFICTHTEKQTLTFSTYVHKHAWTHIKCTNIKMYTHTYIRMHVLGCFVLYRLTRAHDRMLFLISILYE